MSLEHEVGPLTAKQVSGVQTDLGNGPKNELDDRLHRIALTSGTSVSLFEYSQGPQARVPDASSCIHASIQG